FFLKKFQLISEIRSLSADWLPSLLTASGSGVLASQLFGRRVAHFFHPIRVTVKNMKDNLDSKKSRLPAVFFLKKFQLISEIRSLSADWLPSPLTASGSGVLASQLFGRRVAHFLHPIRVTVKNMKDNLVLFYNHGSGWDQYELTFVDKLKKNTLGVFFSFPQ
ncbi:hypothetical protein, partial [Peribacillus sp. NPDC096448]|uniref:hypothetical protein n=1 Tax=Peribacillus sp. NPDC096448 TaxID=3364395 RepID=UPI0037FDB514